jgi:hypothetical protein
MDFAPSLVAMPIFFQQQFQERVAADRVCSKRWSPNCLTKWRLALHAGTDLARQLSSSRKAKKSSKSKTCKYRLLNGWMDIG